MSYSAPEILGEPWDVWGVNDDLDQADYDECEKDGIYADSAAAALSRFPSFCLATRAQSVGRMSSVSHDDFPPVRGPGIKRETMEDYCFGMTFTEGFVPTASSLKRPLPMAGTIQDENYRYDLPLRRLEPTPGTIEHKDYMYDAISALLEKTRSLNNGLEFEDKAEINSLCQNVEQILENWPAFDVAPHDFSKVNPELDWWVQEYECALAEDDTPFCIEELREYEDGEEREDDDDDDEDDGFQEPTEYEKENENELYMWGGLK